MDKSLDEYAKENKIGGNRRGGFRRGRGGRFNVNSSNSNRGGGGAVGAGNPRRSNGGGIQKRRPRGLRANASMSNQWNHDLFKNGQALNSARFRRPNGLGSGIGLTKLIISNLDFGVTDSDIKGLFSEFGKIRKAAVHYDRTGRSLGTADVLFDRKSDAIRALSHYNGVSLDGRPMNIQLTTSLSALNVGRRGGGAGVGGGRGRGRGGRGGGGPRRGGRQNQQSKSAADLDADLDAHNAKMQTD